MKITIPRKEAIHQTSPADPIKWYYVFGTKSFFLHRLRMCLAMLGTRKYEKLLDIGYGSGIFFPELFKRCHRLYGTDVHANRTLVERMLEEENMIAELSQASVTQLPYPSEFFDGVVCMSVLEHIKDLKKAVAEITRVTKPGGTIVLGFPVDNKLTHLALKISYLWLPGARLKDEHVSSHTKILEEIRQQLFMEESRKFPWYLPLDFSVYFACRCRKKNPSGN